MLFSMTPITKKLATIEHHCIEQRYSHLRVYKRNNAIAKLMTSIERDGQLVPVIMITEPNNKIVLIDGYLRLQALQKLGKDTIDCELWHCDATEALLMLLKNHTGRALDTFEEALLLQELKEQHSLSQADLATRVGRDRSWVGRRLSLLEFLPENILQALRNGSISLWVASRILEPVARATPEHAQLMLDYLLKNHHSTRELQSFYHHYQHSNRQERTNMINQPDLFFKAQKLLTADKKAAKLKDGPEGIWKYKLDKITKLLSELIILMPSVFCTTQKERYSNELIDAFNRSKTQFIILNTAIERLIDA